MKVVILEADVPDEGLISSYGTYAIMIKEWLGNKQEMASYSSYDVRQADWRKSVDVNDVDLFVITGARASVCDADPWMTVLEDFVRDVWWTQAKMLGICFGHQIIAKAMGGKGSATS